MTGSHEVRGSIPLGSINNFNKLGAAHWLPLTVLCAYSVPSIRDCAAHTKYEREKIERFDAHFYIGTIYKHANGWIIIGLFYSPKAKATPSFG
jgi:hypothetical protein